MDYTSYFKHVLGLTSLMAWIKLWERIESSPTIENNIIYLGNIASQRIGFGVPKSKRYGKYPFLAFQKEERQWMELIPWNRCFMIKDNASLILISEKTIGDGQTLSDLPALALVIPFDQEEKINILKKTGYVGFRGLWEGEESDLAQLFVESGPAWNQFKIKEQNESDDWFLKEEMTNGMSFAELMSQKINASNRESNPGYLGNPTQVGAQFKDLVEGFDPNKIIKVTDKLKGV